MARLRLRAQLVAAFVGIAALTTLVAALLTSVGLHRQFDAYLEQRTQDAASRSVSLAQAAYAGEGGWTPQGLDLLAHELALTGYDFRLTSGGRVLLDTTKLEQAGVEFRRVTTLPVQARGGEQVGELQLYALDPKGSLPPDDALRAELDRAHLIAAAIAAVVAIMAGLVVAGRLSRPLQRLAEAARGLARGTPPPARPSGSPEVRELGEALAGLAGDLERQQRSRRQLAQDLSHELRTPLTLLQSRIEAMQDGVVPFDSDGLAALHTQTLRLSALIGQIERLAEAEAHPPPMREEEIALDELARESHAAMAAAFELRGLTLELDASPARARGDRDAVRQIAANLLSNALKYAPRGSAVRIATSCRGGRATLRVRDDGDVSGSPDTDRFFDRFYRGGNATAAGGGAGLGLTIAKGLAVAQGGDLALDPSGPGTSFVLWLPAVAADGSAVAGAPPTPGGPGTGPDAGAGHVTNR